MVLGYILAGAFLGAITAIYAFLAWEVSLWVALAIYAGMSNLGALATILVALAVEALRTAAPFAARDSTSDHSELEA